MFASKPVSEHVSFSDVRPSEPIDSSHAGSSNIVSVSNIRPRKPSVLVMFIQVNVVVLIMSVQVDLSVEVSFVKVNQLVIVIFIINLFVQTIFVSLIHHYQLNRYYLYF